jgi:hypothetical protein
MDFTTIVLVTVGGLGVAGFVLGRWWVLGLPAIVVPILYVGANYGWWGSGLGDGWQFALAFVLVLAITATGAGLVARATLRRAR